MFLKSFITKRMRARSKMMKGRVEKRDKFRMLHF